MKSIELLIQKEVDELLNNILEDLDKNKNSHQLKFYLLNYQEKIKQQIRENSLYHCNEFLGTSPNGNFKIAFTLDKENSIENRYTSGLIENGTLYVVSRVKRNLINNKRMVSQIFLLPVNKNNKPSLL